MRICLANPRGFCAGVNRAISIVKKVLEVYGAPVYVLHEIVHNRYVTRTLRDLGVIFIDNICEAPDGSILIFSAHGVPQSVQIAASNRDLKVFDATCPLVTKVHKKVAKASHKGIEVVLIGHAGHPEIEGTMGQYMNPAGGMYLVKSTEDVKRLQVKNANNICFVTQTTMSADDASEVINSLRQYFPGIIGARKNDICYATTNRQEAVSYLVTKTDMVLVIGSQNSSNSNRLVEIVQKTGKPVYLIDDAEDICDNWLYNSNTIGITGGASTPDLLIQQVIKHLQKIGIDSIEELVGKKENMIFEVPKELRCM